MYYSAHKTLIQFGLKKHAQAYNELLAFYQKTGEGSNTWPVNEFNEQFNKIYDDLNTVMDVFLLLLFYTKMAFECFVVYSRKKSAAIISSEEITAMLEHSSIDDCVYRFNAGFESLYTTLYEVACRETIFRTHIFSNNRYFRVFLSSLLMNEIYLFSISSPGVTTWLTNWYELENILSQVDEEEKVMFFNEADDFLKSGKEVVSLNMKIDYTKAFRSEVLMRWMRQFPEEMELQELQYAEAMLLLKLEKRIENPAASMNDLQEYALMAMRERTYKLECEKVNAFIARSTNLKFRYLNPNDPELIRMKAEINVVWRKTIKMFRKLLADDVSETQKQMLSELYQKVMDMKKADTFDAFDVHAEFSIERLMQIQFKVRQILEQSGCENRIELLFLIPGKTYNEVMQFLENEIKLSNSNTARAYAEAKALLDDIEPYQKDEILSDARLVLEVRQKLAMAITQCNMRVAELNAQLTMLCDGEVK